MTSVRNENTQFEDELTGELINNGFIYIGLQNLDPVLNPKTIYPDRALAGIPLANPQRTGTDGRSINKIWVEGKYSVKVTDSAGAQKLIDLDKGDDALVGNSLLINSLGINDVVVTGSPTIQTLIDNQTYVFTAPAANTGAMTLEIDSIPAKDIRKGHDQAMENGDVKEDQKLIVVYNETDDWFEMQSAVAGSVFSGNISVGQDIVIDEQADHSSTPEAGKGLIWVRDDSPNSLIYTDDAGTDFVITAPQLQTPTVTTTGTSFDHTGIPSWVTRVTVLFKDVNLSGTSVFSIQLGDAGGIETDSTYETYTFFEQGASSAAVTAATATAFDLMQQNPGTANNIGKVVLDLQDASTNTWVLTGQLADASAKYHFSTGSKSLSGVLTQFRLKSKNGTDTFTNGSFSVKYE